jgi:hypothetical protein
VQARHTGERKQKDLKYKGIKKERDYTYVRPSCNLRRLSTKTVVCKKKGEKTAGQETVSLREQHFLPFVIEDAMT